MGIFPMLEKSRYANITQRGNGPETIWGSGQNRERNYEIHSQIMETRGSDSPRWETDGLEPTEWGRFALRGRSEHQTGQFLLLGAGRSIRQLGRGFQWLEFKGSSNASTGWWLVVPSNFCATRASSVSFSGGREAGAGSPGYGGWPRWERRAGINDRRQLNLTRSHACVWDLSRILQHCAALSARTQSDTRVIYVSPRLIFVLNAVARPIVKPLASREAPASRHLRVVPGLQVNQVTTSNERTTMTTAEINKQLADDRTVVGTDAGELMSAAAGRAQLPVGQIRTRMSSVLRSTRAVAQRAQSSAVATVKATDQCVRAHPYHTIGVFFGLGLLTGVILARKWPRVMSRSDILPHTANAAITPMWGSSPWLGLAIGAAAVAKHPQARQGDNPLIRLPESRATADASGRE